MMNMKISIILLSACDAAFVSFTDNDLWKKTIPAKLQSYMACGKMIIAAAGGETRRIIGEASALGSPIIANGFPFTLSVCA